VQEWLGHPAVQGGLAPLLAGLAAALLLYPVRLSGLAAACGFFATVYLTGQLAFERKLLMVSLAAPLLGALADLAFRPTRSAGVVLGIVFGLASFWVFLTTIGQMPAPRLVPYAVGVTALVAASVAFSVLSQDEAPRAGAAGVGLGLATGTIALLGGAKALALSGFGLAAGAAGFLIIAMMLGRRMFAGAALTLSIGVIGSVLAAAVVLQRGLPWYYAALLALVPLAVRLPVPQRGAAGQGLAALFYALAVAAGICALVWMR
jgi:hypothetical protein